jgi:hypothetical protein
VQYINAARLKRLTALGRISRTVTTRKGRPVRAFLHRMPGEPKPSQLMDCVGTKYAYRQHLDDCHRCFRLRALGDDRNDDEHRLAPEGVRPIFLQVLLDCTVTAQA